MDFGMPTLIELPEIPDCAALCRQLGLQFVELNMNLPQYQVNALDEDQLLRTAKRENIYYTVHLDETLDPCNFNPWVAEAWTKTVLETIGLAKRLGAPVLNMHLNRGVYFTLPDRKVFLYEQEQDRCLSALRDFRDRAAYAVGASGIRLCIENTEGYDPPFLEKSLDLLLESPAFALTLDVGHDACIGGADLPRILARASRLTHMHLHDSTGSNAHLPLGDGGLDIPAMLDLARRQNCRVVLETKTVAGLKKSAAWLKTTL